MLEVSDKMNYLVFMLNLFIPQRTALHYGHEGRCTLIYANEINGLPEMLQFNPINGKVISTKSLGTKLIKAILLHHPRYDMSGLKNLIER